MIFLRQIFIVCILTQLSVNASQHVADKTTQTAPSTKTKSVTPPSGIDKTQEKKETESAPPTPPPSSQPAESKTVIVDGSKTAKSDLTISEVNEIRVANRGTYVINLKQPAGQILLTDPKIADVQMVTTSTLYVYGRSPGRTEIVITSQDMSKAYRYFVTVESDLKDLDRLIHNIAPGDLIQTIALPDGILLQGTVSTAKIAEDLKLLAQRFVGSSGTVVNQLNVRNSSQVSIQVKIAEVKKSITNQLGINWSTLPLANQSLRFGLFNTASSLIGPTLGVNGDSNVLNFLPNSAGKSVAGVAFRNHYTNFYVTLQALANENLANILAEPNLVTTSGEEARFLAGGEIPYPVTQGTGANATVTIQFKTFGISLSFLPTVVGDTIHMRIRPEVSEVDATLSVKDNSGNVIPAISTRRAESSVRLQDGQSIVMAGLLSDSSSSSIDSMPILGDMPILGALFRSNDYRNRKTELVIFVTAHIVEPLDSPKDVSLPTDGLRYSSLMDMVMNKRINEPTGNRPSTNIGSAGFYY